jgi:hypothetical protein
MFFISAAEKARSVCVRTLHSAAHIEGSNSRTDSQESRIIACAFMVSRLAHSRYFHATSKPNRCDPYATLQDFFNQSHTYGRIDLHAVACTYESGASS